MTTYFNKSEIENSIKDLATIQLKECVECEKLSEDFIDLIKYNFSAKYVSFDTSKKLIEIGVEDTEGKTSHYPVINVLSYPVSESKNKWLDNSFKNKMNDLVFYGRLINRKKYSHRNAEVVVM
ncbi:hypothetical protein JM83_2353 [Gillisia sp. Hel_I_86]|uniref:hypothetical protein n=1 Tax=Gillisia sp. Hel_I_86 TaxID=1249981 RepID=UPI001198EA28|nr:hypothetical protein [Gillisia sp. Hel_I_86]TVZ27317.1 hypothetical protein JM83_2353 [Gillisia sp. Hel_I_86]